MKWRPWKDRNLPKASPAAGEQALEREAPAGGNRLQRAARRLRRCVPGARDDLGHPKHRHRWLAWELSD